MGYIRRTARWDAQAKLWRRISGFHNKVHYGFVFITILICSKEYFSALILTNIAAGAVKTGKSVVRFSIAFTTWGLCSMLWRHFSTQFTKKEPWKIFATTRSTTSSIVRIATGCELDPVRWPVSLRSLVHASSACTELPPIWTPTAFSITVATAYGEWCALRPVASRKRAYQKSDQTWPQLHESDFERRPGAELPRELRASGETIYIWRAIGGSCCFATCTYSPFWIRYLQKDLFWVSLIDFHSLTMYVRLKGRNWRHRVLWTGEVSGKKTLCYSTWGK